MKISMVIERLEAQKAEHGDIAVKICGEKITAISHVPEMGDGTTVHAAYIDMVGQ